jgi:shikimate dehydrogenase
MMFIYQAHQAFTIWHKIMPKIDDETIKLLDL